MKKTNLFIALMFFIITIIITSCKKDERFIYDGKYVGVGVLDNEHYMDWEMTVSKSNGKISFSNIEGSSELGNLTNFTISNDGSFETGVAIYNPGILLSYTIGGNISTNGNVQAILELNFVEGSPDLLIDLTASKY